jgi:hypothetical protein
MGVGHSTRRCSLLVAAVLAVALLPFTAPAAQAAPAVTAVAIAADPLGPGYWVLRSDGSVVAKGSATKVGGAPAFDGRAAGLVAFPTGGGFWRMRSNGGVAAFGAADVSAQPRRNRQSAFVGVAPTPSGNGLWRATALGNVAETGTAPDLRDPNSAARIVSIVANPERVGYWALNRRGRVFGSGASDVMGPPVGGIATGLAAHPSGDGYWVVRASGAVQAFGVSQHYGNAGFGDVPAVDIAASPDGLGYWVLARDGRVASFGTARSGVISIDPPPTPSVTTVGGIVVNSQIARRVRHLLSAARDAGIRYGGWGYRSYARQVELRQQNCGPRYYDVYVVSSSECSPMTARPGASMHELGKAIDFYKIQRDGSTGAIAGRAFRWLDHHAAKYGLYNLPSEPWHWSTNGH